MKPALDCQPLGKFVNLVSFLVYVLHAVCFIVFFPLSEGNKFLDA